MKIKNIYRELFREENYKIAYEEIKSKPGNMTPGIDAETLDTISVSWIKQTIKEMKDCSFKFNPSRRTYKPMGEPKRVLKRDTKVDTKVDPKVDPKGGGKQRVLGISSLRDRVVQKVLQRELESQFEKIFLDSSHGFRPARSCHTALKEVITWRRCTWVIEGDIKGYFDNIDHKRLSAILSKHIEDSNFLDLYWKLVKAGYVETNSISEHVETNSISEHVEIGPKRVPLGGLLSPLLSNIYLHELDNFIEELKLEYGKELNKLEYREEWNKQENEKELKTKAYLDVEQELNRVSLKSKIPESLEILRKLNNKLMSIRDTRIKIYYVRYGDVFLVGVKGTKELAFEIRDRIKDFLEKELLIELNLDKTRITNISNELVPFLGFTIGTSYPKAYDALRLVKPITSSSSSGQVNIYLPIDRLLEWLITKGFAKKKGLEIIGKYFGPWINLEIEEIVMRYKAVLMDLCNYYLIAKNVNALNKVRYILIFSCAHTLAAKLKVSIKAIFRKYGKYITLLNSV